MGRAFIGLATGLLLAVPTSPIGAATASVEAETAGQVASSAAARTHTDRERRYQRKVFHWTNVARRRHDLPPLHRVKCLRRIAVHWSEHLARTGDFEHQNLNVIFRRCDRANAAGENIARGGVSPKRMVRLWMNSPGHRANILNRRYTHLGVGAAVRNGQWTGVQDFARIRR
jgi:uncharacterized protein YkwD